MSDLDKLRWRCRRGTLELDLVLRRYLETRFSTADRAEQQAFLALLEQEDDELIRYLLGQLNPPDPALAALVSRIRALPVQQ